MKERFIENGIVYVRNGDYYLPNLTVPGNKVYNIGKYGRRYAKLSRRTDLVSILQRCLTVLDLHIWKKLTHPKKGLLRQSLLHNVTGFFPVTSPFSECLGKKQVQFIMQREKWKNV